MSGAVKNIQNPGAPHAPLGTHDANHRNGLYVVRPMNGYTNPEVTPTMHAIEMGARVLKNTQLISVDAINSSANAQPVVVVTTPALPTNAYELFDMTP